MEEDPQRGRGYFWHILPTERKVNTSFFFPFLQNLTDIYNSYLLFSILDIMSQYICSVCHFQWLWGNLLGIFAMGKYQNQKNKTQRQCSVSFTPGSFAQRSLKKKLQSKVFHHHKDFHSLNKNTNTYSSSFTQRDSPKHFHKSYSASYEILHHCV